MPSQKHHQSMRNLRRCYDTVLQSSTKGITAAEVSKKIGMHKTMVHRNLNTLELMGKVEDQHGTWRVRTGKQTIEPLEKEIVIELPMPENQWLQMATMEGQAKQLEEAGLVRTAEAMRLVLRRFNETRIIRITGKNIDNLDLEKIGNLIQQANERSHRFNFKGLLKSFKKSVAANSQKE
jgi:hypothetical protein